MSKFSPGPWREAAATEYTWDVIDADKRIVAMLNDVTTETRRLIAAAPEMYELLKRLAKDVPRLIQPERIAVDAYALLARIDGDS